ncbi:hypothetical protein ACJZ2D_006037 [Fusarium nematophilum]
MSATSVASSSQMFSAFGQPTRSSSPAINPFATKSDGDGSSFGIDGAGDSSRTKRNKRSSRLADQSDNEGRRKPNNPFIDQDANLSDGSGRQKNRKGDDKKRKNADLKKNLFHVADPSKKQPPHNVRSNGINPFAPTRNAESRPTSSSSNESHDDRVPEAHHSNDPHAQNVYEQLRKDGIHPPQWPSQPGNPKNKAEVSRFRERYETYRSKARASLTKAGLIDDPEKRKTLQDAIDFKGICEDMCPEYEKITRINEMDVHQPEKNPKTTFANTRRMVKKLARSAAGQEAPLPMDVRSVAALRRTLDYLIDDLLRNDGNLPTLHGFLWDRTRAIRRDFTFFSSLTPEEMKTQVYVLENIARFHVTALHLLSQDGKAPEDFVEQQELEQLGKALLSLRDAYDDCNDQGIRCENEPEFRAYYLIFHAYDSTIIETLQRQWKPNLWRDSDEVRTAVCLVEALQNTQDFHGPLKDAPSLAAAAAYQSYFRIVEDPKVSYTMACFAECHFPRLRRSILTAIKKSLARPRETSKDVTAAVLNNFLRFDTVEQAIEFTELHDFEFGQSEENPSDISAQYLILDNRKALPHHRLQHQFSQSLVEKKRCSRSLPDLIHQTIHEDANAPKPSINGVAEESLFVSDAEPIIPSGPKTSTPNPFSSFDPPSGNLGGNKAINGGAPGTILNGTLSNPNSTFQQPTQSNPFGPGTAPEAKKPALNPFASTKSPTALSFSSAPIKIITSSRGQGNAPTEGITTPFTSEARPAAPVFAPTQSSPFVPSSTSETQTSKAPSFPSFFAPKTTVPSADTSLPKADEAGSSQSQTSVVNTAEPIKTPGINIVPPTPELASTAFTAAQTSKPTSPSLNSGVVQPTQPTVGLGLNKPLPSAAGEDKQAAGIPGSAQTNASTVQLPFPPLASSSFSPQAASSFTPQSSISSPAQTSQTPKKPTPPLAPPAPPRDLLGDFTRWYVQGDNGLIEDFQAFMLDNILQSVFRKFTKDEERKRQEEEEEKALAEANKFRVYNLSIKFFYRWRDIAREKRLSELRRSARDEMRTYHKAQRAAQLKAQKDAARRAAREKAEIAELNRPEELKDFLKHKKPRGRQLDEEAALLASGVLSGVPNEQLAAAMIVRRPPSVNGSVSSHQSKLSRSSTAARGGSKTQAIREQLLGERSASFRRSLPPMMSRDTASPEPGPRVSRVSERWRLKAMGIVQMPDGTAVPESLANEIQHGKKRPSGVGSMGPPPTSTFARRASVSDLTRSRGRHRLSSSHGAIETTELDGSAAKNKRKRAAEDDGQTAQEADSKSNVHKRVMSDAQNVINELRSMREEMEEGTSWFRDQNERLQSEFTSRGSTPWDQ